jgi:hypothetical protein
MIKPPYTKAMQAGRSARKKKIKNPSKTLKKECDDLRREIIYRRAGYRSELSGKPGRQIGGDDVLDDHHPAGKPNFRLRYELENGICLTKGEHFFIAHNQGEAEKFRAWVLKIKGEDFFERMAMLKNAKTDLRMVKTYLENELKK